MTQKTGIHRNKSNVIAYATALATVVTMTTPMWINAAEHLGSNPGATPIVTPTPATTMDKGMESKPMTPGHMDKSNKNPMSMNSGEKDHANMHGMSATGDVDYDFAVNMRMHHQAAVDMSQSLLDTGKDPELLGLARKIVAAQKQEITVLDKWIAANKKSTPVTMSE